MWRKGRNEKEEKVVMVEEEEEMEKGEEEILPGRCGGGKKRRKGEKIARFPSQTEEKKKIRCVFYDSLFPPFFSFPPFHVCRGNHMMLCQRKKD